MVTNKINFHHFIIITLLTSIWIHISEVFGNSNRSVFISSTIVWLTIFVIFWVAISNMGLSEWKILWIVLPLSWLEMIIGTWIASKLYKKI